MVEGYYRSKEERKRGRSICRIFARFHYCTKKKEENQKELSKRLLTYGFWHSFGISYEESMIERRSNGKPYYIGNDRENEIFFNLSHGQELIAVACADCEVGIDARKA